MPDVPGTPNPQDVLGDNEDPHDRDDIVADDLTLPDGTPAFVVPLHPTDSDRYTEEFAKLSPETRRHRFLASVNTLSEAMLHHLVNEVDGIDHVALVLWIDTEEETDPVAIGRMVRYPQQPDAADLAVTVKDSWQGRGIATVLLPVLVKHRPLGVTRVITEVASDNPASLAMLRRLGPTHVHDSAPGVFDVVVDLDAAAEVAPEPSADEWLRVVRSRPERQLQRHYDAICAWMRSGDPSSEEPHSEDSGSGDSGSGDPSSGDSDSAD